MLAKVGQAFESTSRARLSTLVKIWAVLYLLGLLVFFLVNPLMWIGFARVVADPVSTSGSIVGVQGYWVKYAYVDESGRSHTGGYYGHFGANPPAAEARVGQPITVQYARSDPASSCACDARFELTPVVLGYLGFFVLIVASAVAVVGFGIAQWAKVPAPTRTETQGVIGGDTFVYRGAGGSTIFLLAIVVLLLAGFVALIFSIVGLPRLAFYIVFLPGIAWIGHNVLQTAYELRVTGNLLTWQALTRKGSARLSDIVLVRPLYAGSVHEYVLTGGKRFRVAVLPGYQPFIDSLSRVHPNVPLIASR